MDRGHPAAPPVFSAEEVAARLPVWEAIAGLWLDTVIDAPMLERIAQDHARSPFTPDELQSTYLYEVAPVVHANLKVVAGAWAGFDREGLIERIARHAARRGRLFRWWVDSGVGRWWMAAETEQDWRTVLRRVSGLRAAD